RVGVVRNLDFDHLVDGGDVTTGFSGALRHSGEKLLGVELHALARRADETVTGAAGVAGDDRSARGDVDGDAAIGHVIDRRSLGGVVLAVEVDAVADPQLAHEVDGFAEAGEALLELRPFAPESGGDLVERFSGADTEEHAVR